jgi:hypothetical protein
MGAEGMSEVSIQYFFEEYLKALEQGSAALFAGAGLSKSSGFVDWKELMRDIADELGLSVDEESDLISIAQFHVNKFGSRAKLNSLLIEEFTKDARPTENHRLIADLPLDTVWTTNYDSLLEEAFTGAGKRVDKKTTKENLAQTKLNRDMVVYKMHGDIEQPQDAVLTKDDYEGYYESRQLFSTKLQGDLISRTFLFLGFSFDDPNIEYILSRIRTLIGQKNQRQHFCVMRRIPRPKGRGKARARYEYERTKQELRIADLKRFGIQTVMIDDYEQITDILRNLHRDVYRRFIFVSGSAHDYDPLGRQRVERLSHAIGRETIKRGYNLVSGFGLGIGGNVALGALEELYARQRSISANDRTVLRPFPQEAPDGISRAEFWTRYREDMITRSGFAVFLCGNKQDGGQTITASGVLEEWEIAKRMGKYPIPVGATGHAARRIWDEVTPSPETFYPKGGVQRHFKTLGDENSSDEDIIEAVFAIIKRIVK